MLLLSGCHEGKKQHKSPRELSNEMDEIEVIFGTGNWRLVRSHDTSYFFFSRKMPLLYDVYHYSLNNGDTVGTVLHRIEPQDNALLWTGRDEKLILTNAPGQKLVLHSQKAGNEMLEYQKIDASHVLLKHSDKAPDTLTLTVPIAVFLLRSRYDYRHGTSFKDSSYVVTGMK
jgi:hypothetical protein